MQLTTAENLPLQGLYDLFTKSFSDYFFPFRLTYPSFLIRISHKLHIDMGKSYIAWQNDIPIGFILQSQLNVSSENILYNAGTGVLPTYRKVGVGDSLLTLAIEEAKKTTTSKLILEVIKDNQPAINLYTKKGFTAKRELLSYKLFQLLPVMMEYDLRESSLDDVDRSHFRDFEPSSQDLDSQLTYNMLHERLINAYVNTDLVGYIIFQPHIGRISQLAVHKKYRRNGIGKSLLGYAQRISQVKELTLMNVPKDQEDTLAALVALGFQNQVSQYEMQLTL